MRVMLVIFVIGAYLGEAACWEYDETHAVVDEDNVGIFGGHSIPIELAPYMASLRILNGTKHVCGASIIHEKFLLSAAHCCQPGENFTVIVGTNNVNGTDGELIEVKQINPNKDFNFKDFNKDFCVIELEKPVTFSSNVVKIDLQDPDDPLPEGTKFNATGWGMTQDITTPEILQQVELPLVDSLKCQKIYEKVKNSVPITPEMICAGSKGHVSCYGDSGGPLTRRDGDRDVLVGVTSGGNCFKQAVVYGRVSAVRDWIQNIIDKNSY